MEIGDKIFDKDGKEVEILDITSTSIRLYIKAKSEKGIDSKDWFPLGKDFDNRFKTKS